MYGLLVVGKADEYSSKVIMYSSSSLHGYNVVIVL